MNRDMSMGMRYGVVRGKTILHNRGESKPSSKGLFVDGPSSDAAGPSRIRKFARVAAIAVAAGAVFALVLVACSSTDPKYATGVQGIQGVQPPVVAMLGDGAVPPVDMSCDTSACTVHWSTDIFPNMMSTGPWQCAAGSPCHGGSQAPLMTDSDPTATYNALVAYSSKSLPHRYVQPCADPSESGILCNLSTPSTCGSPMPINGAMTLSAPQIQTITDWLKCGAPNN
jgi:hypothetical protein